MTLELSNSPLNFSIMGVVNTTPDSFSDGGKWLCLDAALNHIDRLVEDGADVIDVGAESTRPGSRAIPFDEEWSRLEPILSAISKRQYPVRWSIDTSKFAIMDRAVEFGFTLMNDVRGARELSDLQLSQLARSGTSYIAMHMHLDPTTMQSQPLVPERAVHEVEEFFNSITSRLTQAGFSQDRIWLDPGIGFGKTDAGNFALLSSIHRWAGPWNVLIGVSRKGFIGRAAGIKNPSDRDPASKVVEAMAVSFGAKMIRTHDVRGLAAIRKEVFSEGKIH